MKTIHTVFQRLWRQWLALTLMVVMAGCATGPKVVLPVVPHAFSFDGLNDKWANSVDLLAYAYGDQYHKVREDLAKPSSSLYAGKPGLPPTTGVNGPMPVGEFLRRPVVHVGVQQRFADLLDRFGHVDLADLALALQHLEGALQLVVQVLEHRLGGGNRSCPAAGARR